MNQTLLTRESVKDIKLVNIADNTIAHILERAPDKGDKFCILRQCENNYVMTPFTGQTKNVYKMLGYQIAV